MRDQDRLNDLFEGAYLLFQGFELEDLDIRNSKGRKVATFILVFKKDTLFHYCCSCDDVFSRTHPCSWWTFEALGIWCSNRSSIPISLGLELLRPQKLRPCRHKTLLIIECLWVVLPTKTKRRAFASSKVAGSLLFTLRTQTVRIVQKSCRLRHLSLFFVNINSAALVSLKEAV